MEGIKPPITRNFPNTYTLTKYIGEKLLIRNRENINLVIFRPSIISGALNEPIKGWCDSIAGMSALMFFISLGFLR